MSSSAGVSQFEGVSLIIFRHGFEPRRFGVTICSSSAMGIFWRGTLRVGRTHAAVGRPGWTCNSSMCQGGHTIAHWILGRSSFYVKTFGTGSIKLGTCRWKLASRNQTCWPSLPCLLPAGAPYLLTCHVLEPPLIHWGTWLACHCSTRTTATSFATWRSWMSWRLPVPLLDPHWNGLRWLCSVRTSAS